LFKEAEIEHFSEQVPTNATKTSVAWLRKTC